MGIFRFLNRDKNLKCIYHIGAWAGNFGDSIIEQSIRTHLQELSKCKLNFIGINCQTTEFTSKLIDEINEKGDMLIIGGGGLVFYRPQDRSKSGWQWNIDINLIDSIKIPVMVYGIGYNQFEYDTSDFLPITNEHLCKTVEKATLFSVRNTGTKRELVRRGCDENKIMVIPDSGMFAKAKHIDVPGLNSDKLRIAFNWTSDRENQTFPEPFEENKKYFVEACLDVLNWLIEKKNAQIFYVGHMGKEFDIEIINRLKQGLTEKPVIIDEVLSDIYHVAAQNAGYLVDVYRQMDITLGMRGHANIVSFGQDTLTIGMGSHGKIRYFLEDIGRSEYLFDVRPGENKYTVSTMKSTFEYTIEHMKDLKAQNERELARQRDIFTSFNKKVLSLLSKGL